MALPTRVTAGIITRKWEAYIDFGEQLGSYDRNLVHSAVKPTTKGINATRFQHGNTRLVLSIAHPSRTAEKTQALVMEVVRALSLELQGEIKVY